jgi:hypothetical protein
MALLPVLTPDQARDWDAAASAAGVAPATLMECAGRAAVTVLATRFAERLRSGVLVACGNGNDGHDAVRTRGTTVTTAPPAIATTVAATASTGSGGCTAIRSSTEVRVDYPARMSSLIGKDVRTGAQECADRFVIELQPDSKNPTTSAFPGYWVRYATGPVTLSPSDQPVTMRGSAVLLVSMGSAMQPATGTTGYTGARDVVPTNVTVIEEYRLVEDFEGQSTWALGIDGARNFAVTVLSNPPRLVVDIQR